MMMSPHDELDLLSSYLDEELDAPERTRLEAHMTACDECRSTLTALQATIADLKTLPEPAPTPQDSWALRAAIRRARSPMRKWQRFGWAAGAVAAAAIAVFAFTLPGNDNAPQDLALSRAEGAMAVPIFQSGDNLTEGEAYGRLLSLAGITPAPGAPGSRAISGGGSSGPTATDSSEVVTVPEAQAFNVYAATAEDRSSIERCVTQVRNSSQEFLEPIRYELSSYESKPAYLLFFRLGDTYELWVMARSDCETLFFAQAGGS